MSTPDDQTTGRTMLAGFFTDGLYVESPYLTTDPCIKCGHDESAIEFLNQLIVGNVAEAEFSYSGGYMEATCDRCVYKWAVESLDGGDGE